VTVSFREPGRAAYGARVAVRAGRKSPAPGVQGPPARTVPTPADPGGSVSVKYIVTTAVIALAVVLGYQHYESTRKA
jgi:hypothetical protein